MNNELVPFKQQLPERNHMNKHITAVIAESGAYHDLQIAPGTTTRDIRTQLGLSDSYLISKRGGQPFGEDENIYGAVADGEKLFLSTPVEVGTREFWDSFSDSSIGELLKRSQQRRQPPLKVAFEWSPPNKPTLSVPGLSPVTRTSVVVRRDTRSIWQQRGWTQSGNEYHGYFRTPYGSWKGKASVSPSGRVELFIQNPPKVLESHWHWICFRKQWGGWYFIHTNNPIADLSSGILSVEQILNEAHS